MEDDCIPSETEFDEFIGKQVSYSMPKPIVLYHCFRENNNFVPMIAIQQSVFIHTSRDDSFDGMNKLRNVVSFRMWVNGLA